MKTPREDRKTPPTTGLPRFVPPPWAEVCERDFREYSAMVPAPIDDEMVALTLLVAGLHGLANSPTCDEWSPLVNLAIIARRAAEDMADAADFPGDVAATMRHRRECGCGGCELIQAASRRPEMVVGYILDLLGNLQARDPGEVTWLTMLVHLAAACGIRYEYLAAQP